MWWRNILSFFGIRRVVDLKCHDDGEIRLVLIIKETKVEGIRQYGVRGIGVWWGFDLYWIPEYDPGIGIIKWSNAPLRVLGVLGLILGFIGFAYVFGESPGPVSTLTVFWGLLGLVVIYFSAHLLKVVHLREEREKERRERLLEK